MHFDIRKCLTANYLMKPIHFARYVLFTTFGSVLMNLTVITVPTILLMTLVFKVKFVLGVGLLLFPISLLMAFLVSFYIDYFVGLLGFYSESVWGISTTKEIIVAVLSGALIPLQFFPDAIQNILHWL